MSSDPTFALSGQVYYRPRILLPEGRTLTVQLINIAIDHQESIIATQQSLITSQVPVAYVIKYLPHEVPAGGINVLSARIEFDGRLEWSSNVRNEVQLGNNDQADLNLQVFQVVN